jgi:hypothetical protein
MKKENIETFLPPIHSLKYRMINHTIISFDWTMIKLRRREKYENEEEFILIFDRIMKHIEQTTTVSSPKSIIFLIITLCIAVCLIIIITIFLFTNQQSLGITSEQSTLSTTSKYQTAFIFIVELSQMNL